MAPMIPRYDGLDDTRLEEVLRERAFAEGTDLWVGRIADRTWRAAYRLYGRTVRADAAFTETEAAVGATKRKALIALAQIDDIGTFG
ncbi:MAG TPA: hypothetical protein VHV53_02710 [Solirubrobacterales bacterium]|jgi:hypothetical protein|nr:hypothetical protein [Solirubrobacterales bacterium]